MRHGLLKPIDKSEFPCYTAKHCRGIAQFGSALGSGPRGRRFKSCCSDHFYAGVAQWQSASLPSWLRGFDSLHPLQKRSALGAGFFIV